MSLLKRMFGKVPSSNERATEKTCRVCGQKNPLDAKFCKSCSSEFVIVCDHFDAFISYRRDTGSDLASLIKSQLENLFHRRIFLDVKELQVGNFDEKLLRRIEETANFILILSKGSLDRCADKSDWLKREIMHALKTGRNIIPVFTEGFAFPGNEVWMLLPPEMRNLPKLNGVAYSHIYQDDAIRKIATYMKTDAEVNPIPVDAKTQRMESPQQEMKSSEPQLGEKVSPTKKDKQTAEKQTRAALQPPKGLAKTINSPIVVQSHTGTKKDSPIIFVRTFPGGTAPVPLFQPSLGESKLEILEVVPATGRGEYQPVMQVVSMYVSGTVRAQGSANGSPAFGTVSLMTKF